MAAPSGHPWRFARRAAEEAPEKLPPTQTAPNWFLCPTPAEGAIWVAATAILVCVVIIIALFLLEPFWVMQEVPNLETKTRERQVDPFRVVAAGVVFAGGAAALPAYLWLQSATAAQQPTAIVGEGREGTRKAGPQ